MNIIQGHYSIIMVDQMIMLEELLMVTEVKVVGGSHNISLMKTLTGSIQSISI